MKTKVLFLAVVALISTIFLSSCGHNSGNLIGTFQAVKKQKANPIYDYGFVKLVSSNKDTLTVFVTSEEEYLNVKTGDIFLVGRNRYGSLFLNNRIEKGVVGYGKVLQKEMDMGIPKCKVITRGQDTISVDLVAEVVYFNISDGDSVLVKKNRDKDKPHYFVE